MQSHTGDDPLTHSMGFDFVDGGNSGQTDFPNFELRPQYAEGLPSTLGLTPALDLLPVDYGLFNMLNQMNQMNMDRMW